MKKSTDIKSIISQSTTNKPASNVSKALTKTQVIKHIKLCEGYTIDFNNSWIKGLDRALKGDKSNQSLELTLISKALTSRKIVLLDDTGKIVDLSPCIAYAEKKLSDKVVFWLKWEGVHNGAIRAFFDRGENRDYLNSVFSHLISLGYTFK